MALLKQIKKRSGIFFLCLGLGFSALGMYFTLPAAGDEQEASVESIRQLIDQANQLFSTEPDAAIELASKARESAKSKGEKELEIDVINSLAMLYYRLNRLDQAQTLLRESLKISEETGYLHGSGISLNRLGNVLWLLEKRLEAKTCFERALAIHTHLGDWREISRTKNNLANAYRYWDDYPRAIEMMIDAREGYQKVDFAEGVAWLNYSLGILHKKLGDYDRALEAINSALETYTEMAQKDGSYNGVMICYSQLGDIYNITGNPEQGLEYHRRALDLREKSKNRAAVADGLSGIAKSYFFLGDLQKSLEYFLQSQAIRDEIGIQDGTATNMKFMGEIYRETGRNDKALENLNRGLASSRELRDRGTESEILEMIADLHASQGRYREAWGFIQEHQAVQDLVLNAEISKKVASLQLQHEIEKQETENERLQGENRIKDLQLVRSRTQSILLIVLSLFLVSGGIVALYLHRKQLQIKTLQGLIPICAHCKSIRTDSGYYQKLETYISEHSDAQFSHGICPDCYEKHYSDDTEDSKQETGRS